MSKRIPLPDKLEFEKIYSSKGVIETAKYYNSGYIGVSWDKLTNKWLARYTVNYKVHRIGLFTDILEAVTARENFIKLHQQGGVIL